jgi:adenylate cyclase
LAARLESATKQFHCDVLVGQSVEELTRAEFVYRRVDLLRLKGKNKPVEVYIPLSTRATPPPPWLEAYHAAIGLYRARRFEEAMQGFRETLAQIGGEDFLCRMYLERCEVFAKTPPAPDWDGGHTLTEK